VAGCEDSLDNGSSGLIPTPVVDLTGDWTGTFASDGGLRSGTVTASFDQDVEGVVSGTSTFTTLVGDPTCWETGPVANTQVDGIVVAGDIQRVPSGFVSVNDTVIEWNVDAAGNILQGEYSVRLLPVGSSCIGETGLLDLRR